MRSFRRVAAAMAGIGLCATAVLAAAPAQAHGAGGKDTYVRSQPNLCRNINNSVHFHPKPYGIYVPAVRGTHDFTEAGGYSLRTCDWKAKAGYVDYRCPKQPLNECWTLAITRRSEKGGASLGLAKTAMICDGKLRRTTYAWSAVDSTDVHLWAPNENALLRKVEVYVR